MRKACCRTDQTTCHLDRIARSIGHRVLVGRRSAVHRVGSMSISRSGRCVTATYARSNEIRAETGPDTTTRASSTTRSTVRPSNRLTLSSGLRSTQAILLDPSASPLTTTACCWSIQTRAASIGRDARGNLVPAVTEHLQSSEHARRTDTRDRVQGPDSKANRHASTAADDRLRLGAAVRPVDLCHIGGGLCPAFEVEL